MDEVDEAGPEREHAEAAQPPAAPLPLNEVRLAGRVAAPPEERTLPSGAQLVVWRLVVPRASAPPGPSGRRAPTVDTVDCVAWAVTAREAAGRLAAGDVVEVQGALRQRSWRAGSTAASRYKVEVDVVVQAPRSWSAV